MADNSHGLCTKQKSWNANYYRFFDSLQRSLMNCGRLFPALLDSAQTTIHAGKTAEALEILKQAREELAAFFLQESDIAQMHHRYLTSTMENYKVIAEAMRDYSTTNGDEDITQMVETHLRGIEDFTLAGIAHLDPER
jgi:hypothetical protein